MWTDKRMIIEITEEEQQILLRGLVSLQLDIEELCNGDQSLIEHIQPELQKTVIRALSAKIS